MSSSQRGVPRQADPRPGDPAPAGASPDPLRAIARATLVILIVLRGGGVFASYALSGTLLNLQDRWLVELQLLLAVLALWPLVWPRRWQGRSMAELRLSGRAVVLLALGLVVVCYAGHIWLLDSYDLSRDEQMASFDTRIYAAHRLAWPIPAAWQGDADALNLLFMLPVSHPVAWVSTYLPGNSLLRALVGSVADPALTGPLLTGGAALALWGCARRLWPEETTRDREAAVVSLLLLVCSGQVVFAGMTAYAMPAHLCLNLVWLWLFLADRRDRDFAALAVGFLATGLHQPLFHPLFVAPFLVSLAWQRRWARLALYGAVYGAIGLFWLWWPHYTHGLVSGPGSVTDVGTGYLARLTEMFAQNRQNLPIMACNLLRFCTWQSLALLPMLIAGLVAARRQPLALALAAGFFAPIVLMGVLLPYQGHGFGYRYLHGLMGNAALLGGYGWRWLAAPEAPGHERVRPLFVRAMVLSAVLLLPVQAWMAHGIYAPFAKASAAINASGADYAIIGAGDGPYALDLVLNRPDLSNHPIRLSAGDIDDIDDLAHRICRPDTPGSVTMALPADSFFDAISAYFHAARMGQADGRLAEQTAEFEDAGCRVIVLR